MRMRTTGITSGVAAVVIAAAAPVMAQDKDIVDTAVAAGKFNTLATALTEAGLVDTLKGEGPFTVFAPTDEAFAKLPPGTVEGLLADKAALTKVLTYHVVAGSVDSKAVAGLQNAETVSGDSVKIAVKNGSVFINDSKVVTADIKAGNGIIHVIDTVLLPPSAPATGTKDIVDTAVAAGNFKTLATALTAAGLIDTLKGEGPFTVFAPTDEAFAKLPPGTVEGLLADKAKLTAVLTYHVVPGKVMAANAAKLTSARTVQGSEIKIAANGGTVKINDATVTAADIEASNGVIHVIDTVILPPDGAAKKSGY
jgi:uncharacterized surface protein with fasciclin (FAS1) repeats